MVLNYPKQNLDSSYTSSKFYIWLQTRYYWPYEKETEDGAMVEKGHVHIKVRSIFIWIEFSKLFPICPVGMISTENFLYLDLRTNKVLQATLHEKKSIYLL